MRSPIAKRIYDSTPEEVKAFVKQYGHQLVGLRARQGLVLILAYDEVMRRAAKLPPRDRVSHSIMKKALINCGVPSYAVTLNCRSYIKKIIDTKIFRLWHS